MSRAVNGRRSAIRNATSESWRISLSVSWLIPRRRLRRADAGEGRAYRSALRGGFAAFEVLVRRAVVAFRQRRALAGLALPRGRAAPCDAAVERARFDLLLDEAHRGVDTLADR